MMSMAMQSGQEMRVRDERTVSKLEFAGPVQVEAPVEPKGVTIQDLLHAAANGYAMIVRYVLAAGIDPNERDERGMTAMMVATTEEVRSLLSDAGAIAEARN